MKKRFERGDRFVEVHVDDRTLTTRAGKLGTDGKTASRKLRTAVLAETEGRKLILGYRKNEWTVVTLEPVPCAPAAALPREPRLESALDDGDTYQVYADWLQAHGNPLGELIVLQTPPLTAAKKRRADAIIGKLGMPAPDLATVGWVRGFWQWLRIENSRDWMDGDFDALHLARGLFAAPMCAALDELRIGVLRWEYLGDAEAVIDEAGKHAWAKRLRRLHLGDIDGNIDMAHHVIGDVGKRISAAFPALRSLRLHSGAQNWHGGHESFGLSGLRLPQLTELVVETCSMSAARCKAVMAAKLPALERLELWFGSANYGADATARELAPLLSGKAFPRVTQLGLRNAEIADDLARALPDTAIAPRLTSLDLSMGTLSDDGAAALAAGASAFGKLEALDVSDNFLSGKGVAALKKAFRKVVSREQKDIDANDPTWRYVTVAE